MTHSKDVLSVAILGKSTFVDSAIDFVQHNLSKLCNIEYVVLETISNETGNNYLPIEVVNIISFLNYNNLFVDRLIVSNGKDSLFQKYKSEIRQCCISNEIQLFELDEYKFFTKIPFISETTIANDLDFLLDRPVNHLDIERISSQLDGERILITGAAGSIGSEIVKQLSQYNCEEICLIDQAESSLFSLQQNIIQCYPAMNYRFFVSDVTLHKRMELIISEFRPTIIFHAAAYKHVPLMEQQPYESIRVNVGGVVNLANIAIKYNVKRFVMISSDKAVNPSNVMGACKRTCELYLQALAQDPQCLTKFIITRFGNVLGSNGSVVPLFIKQILSGGPIQITSKRISRYFMTIREACELVLEAGLVGQKGEIFIFDMGKPVNIFDLALKIIRSFGLQPYKDIGVKEIGLRPGEKLTEELFGSLEQKLPTHNPKIFISKVEPIQAPMVLSSIHDVLRFLDDDNSEELVRKIKKIVVNYISKNSPFIRLDEKNDSNYEIFDEK